MKTEPNGTVVLGGQWGDEGKGKIIDHLTPDVQMIVRCQGGNNAGHTVLVGDQQHIFHLLPSGILHPQVRCVIGHGVVTDPVVLRREIERLKEHGIDLMGEEKERLHISDRSHIILPHHRILDGWQDEQRGKGKIDTTKRGIGPAYATKAYRTGLRLGICSADDSTLFQKVLAHLAQHSKTSSKLGAPTTDVADAYQSIEALRFLRPFVTDTIPLLHNAMKRGTSMLFEGAQGTMLDIDVGTTPYTTSSNTTIGGICTGSGVPPTYFKRIIVILKAYTTRVGGGPFPTELEDETGKDLRDIGKEYGATTGRPRRCGWLDIVVARHGVRINGATELAITKLDVLDGFKTIRICTGYRHNDTTLETIPADIEILAECKPVYEVMPGWRASIRGITDYADLPQAAKDYLVRISELTGVPIRIISVGPERSQTIVREDIPRG